MVLDSNKMMRKYKFAIIFAIAVISVSIVSYLISNFDSPPASKLETPLPQISKSKNPVTPTVKSEPSIGTNLSGISYWSSQHPFLDAFKSSGAWITQNEKVWDTKESDRLDLDENGWVKSLPRPGSGSQYTSVGTLMFRDLQGRYPGGQYVVLYQGQGTIEYGFDAKKNQAASRFGRDVIDVTPSNAGIWLKITATDPNRTGNYLRNIRVVPIAYENSYQRQIFNPDFIEKVKAFKVFRFMDWMATNGSTQRQWSDRPTPQDARYSIKGVPVELMVELSNRTNSDPWFTMPHMASDEYIANFAQYVENNLEPGRKVYVEYSNEVWNGKFPQNRWALQQGKAHLSGTQGSDYTKAMRWYGKRTTEITQIWDRVFGKDKDRVIGVMAGQAANPQVAKDALSYPRSDRPLSHQEYGIDAIAIAPYFGGYLGSPKHQDQVVIWTLEADGGLDLLFEEIAKGGVLSDGSPGGALQQAYNWIETHAELARQENLQLLAYEGGQHLAGVNGVENNDAITELFIQANRNPRMGKIYKEYLKKWFELGGGLFVNFSDIGQPSKWGSWGILEYVEQDSTPKYDAFLDLLDRFSSSKQQKS
ncbi:MAG: cellulose-binding protein [Hydrococcus sp. C42_A2020_068]|nr:cellulose-binding protein [Hydrococcus sp. C42_A2020_068]